MGMGRQAPHKFFLVYGLLAPCPVAPGVSALPAPLAMPLIKMSLMTDWHINHADALLTVVLTNPRP
jgi:hypothetical protein